MAFYSVPRTVRYLLAVIVLMVVITVYNYPWKIFFFSSNSHHRLQNSTQIPTKDSIFNSLNSRMAYFDVDKFNTVFEQMDTILIQEKKSIISFLSQPIINNHSFEYFHNPENTCTDSPTEILIVVPSAPGNFEQRQKTRNGDYGKFLNITENQTKLVFFIGVTKVNTTQHLIDQESNTYQDIVQESFEDIYQNIRYKAVSMLKWASTFCPGARYVIRVNDDIFTNMTSIVKLVKRKSVEYSNFILGRVRVNAMPRRTVDSKDYLSHREYPETLFPPYALGGLLGYPILTVELLYQAALRVKPIWLDDVYITGLCAPKVGVQLLSDQQFEYRHKP